MVYTHFSHINPTISPGIGAEVHNQRTVNGPRKWAGLGPRLKEQPSHRTFCICPAKEGYLDLVFPSPSNLATEHFPGSFCLPSNQMGVPLGNIVQIWCHCRGGSVMSPHWIWVLRRSTLLPPPVLRVLSLRVIKAGRQNWQERLCYSKHSSLGSIFVLEGLVFSSPTQRPRSGHYWQRDTLQVAYSIVSLPM